MTDEPTQRLVGALKPTASCAQTLEFGQPSDSAEHFGPVPEHPSNRPDAFPEREGPTLASPNSAAIPMSVSLEERIVRAHDRIRQLESDLQSLNSRMVQLSEAVHAERRLGRAARLGRYLLWGSLIAGMATFWMMLRMRLGPR